MLESLHWRIPLDSSEAEEQFGELRTDALRLFLALGAAAYVTWHYVSISGQTTELALARADKIFVVAVPVLVATYVALSRGHRLATAVFIGGSLVTVSWALHVLDAPEVAGVYPILALVAAVVVHPLGGFLVVGAAVAALALLGALRPGLVEPASVWHTAIFGGFAVVTVWVLTHHLLVALKWYAHSYAQAERQTREVQEHRAQLIQARTQLEAACQRLEQANEELERARRAAEEARQLKAEFAASISHELRTPLNLIIGFSEMMVMNPETYGSARLPPSYRGDVEAIYRSACHLSDLIDDVLDLGKIEAHRMALQREPVQLAEVVEEAAAAIKTMFWDKGLTLEIRLPPSLPILYADRTRLRQVLINLLNNAVRFTSRGGVTIGATHDDHEVTTWVTDTGVGIPATDLPHVFDQFFQIEAPNWRRSTGLGLTISKRFIELHGGNMWVESKPGEGSTFYFALPLSKSVVAIPARDEWQTWVRNPANEVAPRTVVVLDDDPEAARVFQRYLDGYRVLGALDASQLHRIADTQPVHALIVTSERVTQSSQTLALPPELLRVPIVTCPLTSCQTIGHNLGITRYLAKPVTRDQVHEVLHQFGGEVRDLLIVDDDPEMVRLLARMAQSDSSISERCRVLTASDGVEALQVMRECRPDIVLLDLLMPRVDGYSVLAQMRSDERLREVPVVLVTAKGIDERVISSELRITRDGGISVGEVMRCLTASLNVLLGMSDEHSARAHPATPAG